MCDVNVIAIQRTIREKLDERGIALKVLAAESGIPYPTLCTYFPGNERSAFKREPAQLPLGAIYRLCGSLPDDLLNLLFPDGYAIVQVPSGIDYDDIAAWTETYTAAKLNAHRADSEHQERIGPNEKNELDGIVVAFPGKAA